MTIADKTCALCDLEKKTKWHYEDDQIIICDCMTCNIPMVVLRRHTMTPTCGEIEHMKTISRQMFGDIMFRVNQRRIHDHLHWHLLRKDDDKNTSIA